MIVKSEKKEVNFCKWYTGVYSKRSGETTELNAYDSAIMAGFNFDEADAMVERVKTDLVLQGKISEFQVSRNIESINEIHSRARRMINIVSDIAEDTENDAKVRLSACKEIINISSFSKQNSKDSSIDNKQLKAREAQEERERLTEVQEMLMNSNVEIEKSSSAGDDIVQ